MNAQSIVTIVTAVAVGFMYFRSKKDTISSDTVNAYKNRVDQLEKENKDYDTKLDKVNHELGRLTGMLEKKDQELERYIQIFQLRNPEMAEFMKTISSVASAAVTHMASAQQDMIEVKNNINAIKEKLALT